MAFHLLRILLFISSASLVGFGLLLFISGPDIAFGLLLDITKPFLNTSEANIVKASPAIDAEIRSLAPFLIGYGILVFLAAKHLRTHLYYVPHLLTVIVMAGVGRLISYFIIGTLYPLFYVLLAAELGLPLLLFIIYRRIVSALS